MDSITMPFYDKPADGGQHHSDLHRQGRIAVLYIDRNADSIQYRPCYLTGTLMVDIITVTYIDRNDDNGQHQ